MTQLTEVAEAHRVQSECPPKQGIWCTPLGTEIGVMDAPRSVSGGVEAWLVSPSASGETSPTQGHILPGDEELCLASFFLVQARQTQPLHPGAMAGAQAL